MSKELFEKNFFSSAVGEKLLNKNIRNTQTLVEHWNSDKKEQFTKDFTQRECDDITTYILIESSVNEYEAIDKLTDWIVESVARDVYNSTSISHI